MRRPRVIKAESDIFVNDYVDFEALLHAVASVSERVAKRSSAQRTPKFQRYTKKPLSA